MEAVIPTAAVVYIKDSKVLLVRHNAAAGHITGTYGLPCGRLEESESFVAAASRELFEETGLRVAIEDLKEFPDNNYAATIPRKDGTLTMFSMKVFYCTDAVGELADSDEASQEWVSLDSLSSLNLLPNVEKAIIAVNNFTTNA